MYVHVFLGRAYRVHPVRSRKPNACTDIHERGEDVPGFRCKLVFLFRVSRLLFRARPTDRAPAQCRPSLFGGCTASRRLRRPFAACVPESDGPRAQRDCLPRDGIAPTTTDHHLLRHRGRLRESSLRAGANRGGQSPCASRDPGTRRFLLLSESAVSALSTAQKCLWDEPSGSCHETDKQTDAGPNPPLPCHPTEPSRETGREPRPGLLPGADRRGMTRRIFSGGARRGGMREILRGRGRQASIAAWPCSCCVVSRRDGYYYT